MGDNGSTQSRYVKLTKEQAPPVDDITPGELNQPIQVPQLIIHRCHECGQPLPDSYEPPADEDWATSICACTEDFESCRTGFFCPCVLFGRNVETLREDIPWNNACMCHAICVEGGMAMAAATVLFGGIDIRTSFLICEGLFFAWWMCGIYTGLFRQSLQKKYHLKDSPCDPCLVHCCMHWCALCQEHREMRNHLSDQASLLQMTVINPPSVQQMTTSTTTAQRVVSDSGHVTLEIQPV
ncbi:Cell number regulator 6 [Linum grandiflorum]